MPDKSAPIERLRDDIKTHAPNLGDELQSAINALKRLQSITGSIPGVRLPDDIQLSTHGEDRGTLDTSGMPDLEGAAETPILSAGDSFGRYQITRQLGKGAMGAVYLAYDSQLERYVAIKTPLLGNNPMLVKRFFREARSVAQIRSPYVCPIYDVGSVGQIVYLSMAFIEGMTLSDWIQSTKERTIDDVCKIFEKILLGLQKAHNVSIIHRDLKPDNIIVDNDSDPIIMDFGLARRENEDVQLTNDGGLLGTPAYMSPEQVRGDQKEVGQSSDLYSAGVVLYQMLTGTLPFRGSIVTVLHQIVNSEPEAPSSIQPALTAESPIERVCLKLLQKDKALRYATAEEALADLPSASPTSVSAPGKRKGILRRVFSKTSEALASLSGKTAEESTDSALGRHESPRTHAAIDATLDQ